jgi:hypothetical protein
MLNYETWQSQLHIFTKDETDYEKINGSFRSLYADSAVPQDADVN